MVRRRRASRDAGGADESNKRRAASAAERSVLRLLISHDASDSDWVRRVRSFLSASAKRERLAKRLAVTLSGSDDGIADVIKKVEECSVLLQLFSRRYLALLNSRGQSYFGLDGAAREHYESVAAQKYNIALILQDVTHGDVFEGRPRFRETIAVPHDLKPLGTPEDPQVVSRHLEEIWERVRGWIGRADALADGRKRDGQPVRVAPFYPDHPATVDALGRKAVAEALATILRSVWAEEGTPPAHGEAEADRTFMIHVHGRWGSGKTSILNFLRTELQRDVASKPWVVVEFNAWRNQKTGPAWWSLLTQVSTESQRELARLDRCASRWALLKEVLWRFRSGWLPYLVGLVVATWVIAVALRVWGAEIKDTATIVATLLTILTGILALGRNLQIASMRTANTFLELRNDPLRVLTRRYRKLVEEIGYPVAVFIDDLDRCDAQYVVELLQTIQTLFRKARVAYVVAADRNWICSSYEQVFDSFRASIAEPGRPLGHLFLEKIFQLSISVPALPSWTRAAFWDRLVLQREAAGPGDLEILRRQEDDRMKTLTTDPEIRQYLDGIVDPVQREVAGAAAFRRLQDREVRAATEHYLQQFVSLLEPNPRAMKRLLNAYGFKLGFELMASGRAEPEPMVRWTIVELRWPTLAERLAGDPEEVQRITRTEASPGDASDEVRVLYSNPEVRAVVERLSPAVVRQLTRGESGGVEGAPAAA